MLGIEITKVFGCRWRTVLRSVMHPDGGYEWWPCEDTQQVTYALGEQEPNYPVPAIPIVADITEYYVILWEHTMTDTLECYGNVWEYGL